MSQEMRKTILCVDDEQDILDSLYDTFMERFEVKIASSGEEALRIFTTEDISIVITDQRMPGMQGAELLARVHEQKPHCKKILLTGYADINAAIDAINKGSVDRYFSKPWDDAEINDAVSHLVEMYDYDKFILKMKEDGERLLKQEESRRGAIESFDRFLDGYLAGVCIIGENDRIILVNKTGMEFLQIDTRSSIEGKDYKEIFLVSSDQKKAFHQRFLKHDQSPEKVDVTMPGGAKAALLASLTFVHGDAPAQDSAGQVTGIIFHKPSQLF